MTPQMEQSFFQAHGVNLEQYRRNLNQRLLIEKKREEDYQKAKNLVNNITY